MDANASRRASLARVVSKPSGGFHPIPMVQLGMAWWAYRSGLLPRYLDFRVYLALHEVAERRLAAARSRRGKPPTRMVVAPRHSELLREVRSLVGSSSDRLVRSSLSRLESAGLVAYSGAFLTFAMGPESMVNGPAGTSIVPARLSGSRRLAVPRPVLRMMARSATPSVAATVLGYLIRCVWWRGSELHVAGSCTAAFISDQFGVDVRSVKRARSALRRVGWLAGMGGEPNSSGDLPQLAWLGGQETGAPKLRRHIVLSPCGSECDTRMSPPTICTQLPSGSKNQQPAHQRRAGIRIEKERDSRPRLSNVRPMDLFSVERMDVLFEEAASTGLVKRSPADRLRFFAAAARASRLGSRNQGGFFAAIVRRGLWHFLSQIDEDEAVEKLGTDRRLIPRSLKDRNGHAATRLSVAEGNRIGCVANLHTLVASVAARCSMERSTRVNGDVGPVRAPMASAEVFLVLKQGDENRVPRIGRSNVTLP